MRNYGRDDIWDPGVWAEIDAAVTEQADLVRVARKIFRTETFVVTDGPVPDWISAQQTVTNPGPLNVPEGLAQPFFDISVPFSLSDGQAAAESTLHTGRSLARAAARLLALEEDKLFFRGTAAAGGGPASIPLAARVAKEGLGHATNRLDSLGIPRAPADGLPQRIVERVVDGITQLTGAGWSAPYALILGTDLYAKASRRIPRSSDTALERLTPMVRHLFVTGALEEERGVLVSLAGDSTTISVARDATTAFIGESFDDVEGARYDFRVFERFQFVIREPSSIVHFELTSGKSPEDASKEGAGKSPEDASDEDASDEDASEEGAGESPEDASKEGAGKSPEEA